MTDSNLLSAEQVASILGCSTDDLKNWRRPAILRGGIHNPRYLPRRDYTNAGIAAWLARPQNANRRELVIASLVPDEIRMIFEQSLAQPQPQEQTT
jgi:hypothetical protein